MRRIGTTDLSGPGVVALGVLLASVGVSVDLVGQPALGMGTGIAVVLFAIVGPAVVRYGSLLTAAVLPPLFVAAAAGALARLGGQNSSSREVALDVGTTLALSAPLVFGATAVGLLEPRPGRAHCRPAAQLRQRRNRAERAGVRSP